MRLRSAKEIADLFYHIPHSIKGGQIETLLNTCNAHSNSAYLLLFNNAFDWLSENFDKKEPIIKSVDSYDEIN